MPTLVNNRGPNFVAGISTADMSADFVSDAFRSGDWLSTSVQIEWPATGTPVGVFSFEASNNSTNGVDGDFRPVTLTVDNQPDGDADGLIVDFETMPWVYVRAVYDRTSGGAGAVPVITFFGKGKAS